MLTQSELRIPTVTTSRPQLNRRPARVQRLPQRRTGPPGRQQGRSPLLPQRDTQPDCLAPLWLSCEIPSLGTSRTSSLCSTKVGSVEQPSSCAHKPVETVRRVAGTASLYRRDSFAVTAPT